MFLAFNFDVYARIDGFITPPGKIYLGTVDGKIFRLNIAGGDLWIPVQLYGSVVKSPSVDEGFSENVSSNSGVSSIWWGTKGGYVYRLNIVDGTILSSTNTVSEITTDIIFDAGFYDNSLNSLNVYFGTKDGKLYCRYGLTLSSVPVGWNDVNVGSKINNILITIEGENKFLYLNCDNGVYKINATNGNIVWYFETESSVVSLLTWDGTNEVYFVTQNGVLYSIDKTTKTIKTGYPIILSGEVSSNISILGNKIYVPTNDGRINVFEK
jgi:outer membrane protein assembly factor BamB